MCLQSKGGKWLKEPQKRNRKSGEI
uniref:Uncharacterized protein n=1 Tax=Tetranychus urticae TaxID=32264 RepID=T1KE15_TETUR